MNTQNEPLTCHQVFNDTDMPIGFRREDAIYHFFTSKKEIELDKSIESYQIAFSFWSHTISHDYDYGTYIEFDRIDELKLFSVKDNQVEINYFIWSIEADRANNYRSGVFLNNEVVIIDNYDGREYLVYDENICRKLGIDFKYR